MKKNKEYMEDMATIAEFNKIFRDQFFESLGLELYQPERFKAYLNHGANAIYKIETPVGFVEDKWQMLPREGMIWISSEINPNGVTGKNDIARTYTIQFEAKCQKRAKYGREWHEDILIKFYGYGRTIEDIINDFKSFTLTEKFQNLYKKTK